jgi:hypothetical protein
VGAVQIVPSLAPTERPTWMAHLPAVVVTEVQRRRDGILAAAEAAGGRVLDLDRPGALAIVLAAGLAGPDPSGAARPADDGGDHAPADRYDTIVSTCRLIDVADLPAAVGGLRASLAPGGSIHLVEPVNRPGTSGLLASSVGALLPAVAGLHLGRDVVAAMRAAGLAVVDLERFVIPTRVWPLRRFVQLRAIVVDRTDLGAHQPEIPDQPESTSPEGAPS